MKKLSLVFLFCLLSLQLFADDDDKQKLAVMEFEDLSGTLSPETLAGATEYIRGAFVSTNKYIVIAKERQEKAMIKEMKKESYKACNDKNCQIPLGQALSADTILRTTISFFGGFYTITSELIDLAKEATIVGAKQTFDGSERSLALALDKIVEQIVGYVKKHDDEIIRAPETKETPKVAETQNEVNKSEAVEEKPAENTQKDVAKEPEQQVAAQEKPLEEKSEPENKTPENTYHPYKIAGISLIVAGAVIAAAGVAGFHVASDKEFDKYKKMNTYDSVSDAVSSGFSQAAYIDKANGHRNKAKTYRALEITSGVAGGAVLVTGIVLAVIKKEKSEEKISLTDISVMPSNEGFYASLGFGF